MILALYLQEGRHLDTLEAGLVLAALGAGYLVTSTNVTRITPRLDKGVIAAGGMLRAIALAALVIVTPRTAARGRSLRRSHNGNSDRKRRRRCSGWRDPLPNLQRHLSISGNRRCLSAWSYHYYGSGAGRCGPGSVPAVQGSDRSEHGSVTQGGLISISVV